MLDMILKRCNHANKRIDNKFHSRIDVIQQKRVSYIFGCELAGEKNTFVNINVSATALPFDWFSSCLSKLSQ